MPLPELIEIVPLDKPVRAEITVPGSKSITNRALILAALADGEVALQGALWSEDTQIMVECLHELGFTVNVDRDADEPCNRTITVYGDGGRVPPGGTEHQPLELFVGNAGTAARFLAAFVCLGKGVYRLHGVPRMHERPQAALFRALRELGYRVESEKGNDKLPAKIFAERGSVSRGTFESQEAAGGAAGHRPALRSCKVSIEESSQFASALLLCAKAGGWKVEVVGENAEESPYVALTENVLYGIEKHKIRLYNVEPDASSASYFKGASWLLAPESTDSLMWIRVREPSGARAVQIDLMFSNFFRFANRIRPFGAVKDLTRISRMTDLADSIMTAIVLTPFAANFCEFTDLGRLRVQECDRIFALRTELTKCGAKVIEEGDTLTVYPSELHGAEIETYNDHRMAMCFAILGLKVPGIRIKNPACVKKTFPNFFQKLAQEPPKGLGAEIWEIENGQRKRKLAVEELFAE
jgi:3-phosphoshikimate 1-carboxyvinyltransferase